MLNETLNKMQSAIRGIRDCDAQLGDTGIADKASANYDAKEVAKHRFQRMRRRRERAFLSASRPQGWVARIA